MADRIAQLANCFDVPQQDEKKIYFGRFFDDHYRPVALPKTVEQVKVVRSAQDWKDTNDRANTLKHRWTGEVMSHLPAPDKVRQQVDGKNCTYAFYGTTTIKADDVDRICETRPSRSFNLLVELAKVLDGEIGWEKYLRILDDDSMHFAGISLLYHLLPPPGQQQTQILPAPGCSAPDILSCRPASESNRPAPTRTRRCWRTSEAALSPAAS